MWRSSNSDSMTFELQTFSTDSKFDECFKRFVVECEFVEKSLFFDWFHMHRKPQRTDKVVFFFLKFNLLRLFSVQHNFCSVMCHTVLIWTLTVEITYCYTYLVDQNVPTDTICIRICIRRISKVEMRILTSFVPSIVMKFTYYSSTGWNFVIFLLLITCT